MGIITAGRRAGAGAARASLTHNWHLLGRYLRPAWPRLGLLGLTLAVTIGVQVGAPLVAGRFIDRATSGAPMRGLLALALLAIGLALGGQMMAVAETYVAEGLAWSATNALRSDLLRHLLRLDAAFHTAHTPGELIERVDGDVAHLSRVFSRFVIYVLGNGLLLLAMLGVLATVDWPIGLGLGAVVLLTLVVMLRMRAVATPAWAAERQASADFYGFLGEYLTGLEDVRTSGAGAFVLRRCAEFMRVWFAATRRAQMWGYGLVASSEGLFALGMALAFALAAARFRSGALTIGGVYLVFQYSALLRRPAEQIRREVQELQQAGASLGRVAGLLAIAPGLRDGPGDALPPGPLAIEFDDVSFGYSPETPVLHGVSLRVEPGRVLGVVGRTGSGKTTLTRLVPRLYDPSVGAVRLGGIDLRAVKRSALRARIGLVTQEVQLFDASLRDNLTLFDDAVAEARVLDALETLGLGIWLRGLPAGLATRLGPEGVGLSAGEAQMLACARVFLRDPDVVILDEPTARLDPATERLVQAALRRLLAGRTGVVVAHRLETLDVADDILVLEEGRVREHGPRLALAADPASRFAGLLRTAVEGVAR